MNENHPKEHNNAAHDMSGDTSGMPAYFDISGLHDVVSDYENGKLYIKTAKVVGELPALLLKGRVTERYFIYDRQIEKHLQFSEQISNHLYFSWLRDAQEALVDAINLSTHHGQSHFRRLEKWYKQAQGEDKALRSNADFLYFSFSAFMAERFHDIPEVWCDEKEGHDGSGALLALGFLLQAQEAADEAVRHHTNGTYHSFPPADFEKAAWGTAYMCLHHSYPDNMPSTNDVIQNGIMQPKKMLEAAEVLKNAVNNKRIERGKAPFAAIEDVFPALKKIERVIRQITDGTIRIPKFSEAEIEGLKKQTRLFAAADKLDSNFPPDLSAVRTFLTQPERVFYKRLESGQEGISPDEELDMRIERCGNHVAVCDFDRFLYEITRIKTFDGVSPKINYWYAYALRGKGRFLTGAIGPLLHGDGSRFLRAYDHLEKDMIEAVLVKADYGVTEAMRIAESIQATGDFKRVKQLLQENGFTTDTYVQMLLQIHKERNDVERIVAYKIQTIEAENITPDEKIRIMSLIKRARERQDAGLGNVPGPIFNTDHDVMPYQGYLPIQVTKIPPGSINKPER
jgi:hypothetical protein